MAAHGVGEFLKHKLAGLSMADLLRMELEAWLQWLSGSLPGVVGFAVRYAVLKVLSRNVGGMAWIQPYVTIVNASRLTVGSSLGINSGTYINAIGTISIGNYVLIGSNVTISSGKHPIEGRWPPVFARPTQPLPITIEDDVWIGAGAVIMPGVTLRTGTVVGANAVVTRSTDEYSVVVGAPARAIRTR